jgi:Ca2+-binding EF-hand superfamily protein
MSSASTVAWYVACGAAHEAAHVLAAASLGKLDGVGRVSNVISAIVARSVRIPLLASDDAADAASFVRHCGWIFSLALAALALHLRARAAAAVAASAEKLPRRPSDEATTPARSRADALGAFAIAAVATAFDALATDLFRLARAPAGTFLCGNFGLIMLNLAWKRDERALDVLEKMVRITMMRGAQSGGVVTYADDGDADRAVGQRAVRSRVCNGKRTDLSKLVRASVRAGERRARRSPDQIPLYAGHTRFATSSIASLPGTHPHRWTPARSLAVYDVDAPAPPSGPAPRVNVETFICHNGDLEFFKIGSAWYETGDVFSFIERATETPAPATVDSVGVAGLMDLLRCRGCWSLAARYAYLFGVDRGVIDFEVPEYATFERVGEALDACFRETVASAEKDASVFGLYTLAEDVEHEDGSGAGVDLSNVDVSVGGRMKSWPSGMSSPRTPRTPSRRMSVDSMTSDCSATSTRTTRKTTDPMYLGGTRPGEEATWWQIAAARREEIKAAATRRLRSSDASLAASLDLGEGPTALETFVSAAVDGFFDNDLFHATRLFLASARGSFGLGVTCSLDSSRQMIVAARGQTNSVALYPRLGLVLYGSEQAAVKACVGMQPPPGSAQKYSPAAGDEDPGPGMRIDLDDLGGEIVLLDWGKTKLQLSHKEAQLHRDELMGGRLTLVSAMEEAKLSSSRIRKRMVPLEDNPLMLPIEDPAPDVVGRDIDDIPRVLKAIQDDWKQPGMNRMSAFTLGRRLRQRLLRKRQGKCGVNGVDVLVTGCEVSLWLGEQFAADLSAMMPKLVVKTCSSNKILGLFGQEFPVPALGSPLTEGAWDLDGTIVIIVSHSGGTFAPLATSNLMQSNTDNIFVVASEWDTQVGKQLRKINRENGGTSFDSRVFSTMVGVRPAEPCSLSVAATQQVLTLMLQYACQLVVASPELRSVAGCVFSDRDLREMERCNVETIAALTEICGVDPEGKPARIAAESRDSLDDGVNPSAGGFVGGRGRSDTERALRRAGEAWAQHVLEAPRAWIICFAYIVITVTSGYPLISGVGVAAGVEATWALRVMGFFDALLYVFLPQLACLAIRVAQRRPLLHRMTARSVVIGDCPWVSQSMEAFVSKLFACAYSVASVGVLSGNPADHLVHRHTHRVMRGTLICVGRPDGRLSALTSLESTVNLSVNQASSIQNLGVTCESMTIGHNPNKLPLTAGAVFLRSFRPMYLCERLLKEAGVLRRSMSSGALHGEYANLQNRSNKKKISEMSSAVDKFDFVNAALKETGGDPDATLRRKFASIDADGSGEIDFEEFKEAYASMGGFLNPEELEKIFKDGDVDGSSTLDFEEFRDILRMDRVSALTKLGQASPGELHGLVQLEPSDEDYFGQHLRVSSELKKGRASGKHDRDDDFAFVASQNLSMRMYETRFASLQRFVSMCVMFHEMGKRVADFWPAVSFGALGYDMSRTHSIMRIATTASPVSGAEVRDKLLQNTIHAGMLRVIRRLNAAAKEYREHKKLLELLKRRDEGYLKSFSPFRALSKKGLDEN